jgi:integrase
MSIAKIKTSDGGYRWEVRFYEEGRGSKRIRRRFERKSDAESFYDQIRGERRERELNPYKTMTFKDRTFEAEAMYWLEDGRNRFSASHVKRIEGALKELFPRMGHLTLDRFTPELLTKFQSAQKQLGLSNATVNRKTEIITAILNHSTRQRRIPFYPATGFRKLSKNQKEMNFWAKEEALDFLKFISELYPKGSSHRWVYSVYLLALNTALRAGEIWGLKPIDILPNDEVILIRRQFNRVSNDFGQTKSRKQRSVPCHNDLFEELNTNIKARSVKLEETIFMNEQRKPICHDNFGDRQFEKDLKRWGGRKIRFHDLRHTAITLMISTGVDIKTVKEICGHADIATTMNYVHLVPGSVQKVAKIFQVVPEKVTGENNVIQLAVR